MAAAAYSVLGVKFHFLVLFLVANSISVFAVFNHRLSAVNLTANTASEKYLYSPNYPSDYSNNADYEWLITAIPGYIIRLTIRNVDLEQSPVNCQYDRVRIFDDLTSLTNPLRMFCSLKYPTIYSSGPRMTIRFTSDGSNTRKGFVFSYRAVQASMAVSQPSCTSSVPADSLYIAEQSVIKYILPANSENNFPGTCEWRILTSLHGDVVRFSVLNRRVTQISCFLRGNIQVHDGPDSRSPQLSNSYDYSWTSNRREMFVKVVNANGSCNDVNFKYEALVGMTTTSTTMRTSARTTTTWSYYWAPPINSGVIIGSLVGGLCLLFGFLIMILVTICRKRRLQTRQSARATNRTRAARDAHDVFSLNTACDYHLSSDISLEPPPYSSLQNLCSSSAMQVSSESSTDEPPPPYTENFLKSHPPSDPSLS